MKRIHLIFLDFCSLYCIKIGVKQIWMSFWNFKILIIFLQNLSFWRKIIFIKNNLFLWAFHKIISKCVLNIMKKFLEHNIFVLFMLADHFIRQFQNFFLTWQFLQFGEFTTWTTLINLITTWIKLIFFL